MDAGGFERAHAGNELAVAVRDSDHDAALHDDRRAVAGEGEAGGGRDAQYDEADDKDVLHGASLPRVFVGSNAKPELLHKMSIRQDAKERDEIVLPLICDPERCQLNDIHRLWKFRLRDRWFDVSHLVEARRLS